MNDNVRKISRSIGILFGSFAGGPLMGKCTNCWTEIGKLWDVRKTVIAWKDDRRACGGLCRSVARRQVGFQWWGGLDQRCVSIQVW